MSKATILIVENEVIIAMDLAYKLEQLGYEISGMTSYGEEAITHAREQRPDLVLMDIRLAGKMDGVQAAEIICSDISIPVVFLTANVGRAIQLQGKVAESFSFLLKPFNDRDLETHIEMALSKQRVEQEQGSVHDARKPIG